MFRFLINTKSDYRAYGETILTWIKRDKEENSWKQYPMLDEEGRELHKEWKMDAFRSIAM